MTLLRLRLHGVIFIANSVERHHPSPFRSATACRRNSRFFSIFLTIPSCSPANQHSTPPIMCAVLQGKEPIRWMSEHRADSCQFGSSASQRVLILHFSERKLASPHFPHTWTKWRTIKQGPTGLLLCCYIAPECSSMSKWKTTLTSLRCV